MKTDIVALARARRLAALKRINNRHSGLEDVPAAKSLPKVTDAHLLSMFQSRAIRTLGTGRQN